MKKILFILLIFSVYSIYTVCQQREAAISFIEEIHDFGDIKEEDGLVTHSFSFTNTGSLPLVIYEVKSSCGCTTPDWSKEPIKPGNKGFLKATFNPKRRPGNFNKSITVKSNAVENELVVIRIKGNVIPKPKTIEDDYPYLSGNLRFKSNHFQFSKVFVDQIVTKDFPIVNISNEPISVTFRNVPNHIKLVCEPQTLDPNQKGNLKITYDTKIKNDWGFIIDRIYILQNGEEVEKNKFSISATISEDFSNLTEEELAKAPVISFENKEYDFGTIKQQTKVAHNFNFTNTGKSDLIIRKVKASCGCTAVEPKDKVIPPGGSSTIKAIFNAGSRKGNQNKSITIISNDPKNYQVSLKMKGIVETE